MFWDPYFGWDTHMIRSCLFWTVLLCGLISFVTATEGLGWDYAYLSLYDWALGNTTAVLISLILLLVGGFYFWKVQVGDI